ncbi:MAG: DUF1201 domain-containing protein [Acinetobacter sp.]|nr:MAG: DUF1201 domain-containing protein [Acinetobacter sp.]
MIILLNAFSDTICIFLLCLRTVFFIHVYHLINAISTMTLSNNQTNNNRYNLSI